MTEKEFQSSPKLPAIVLSLLEKDVNFKNEFIQNSPEITADIESAATNPNCSCRNRVANYVFKNSEKIASLLYSYSLKDDNAKVIDHLFQTLPTSKQNISGKVAKTSIKEWPDFAKDIQQYGFEHMSTSIVGDDVYVFFI
jgi:hypothetical protein